MKRNRKGLLMLLVRGGTFTSSGNRNEAKAVNLKGGIWNEERTLSGIKPGSVLKILPEGIPVACTRYVDHYPDERAVVLGREIMLVKR